MSDTKSNTISSGLNVDNADNNIYSRQSPINLGGAIFNKQNLIFVLWFLAVYMISYYLLGVIFAKSDSASGFQSGLSRSIDFIVLIILFIILFFGYFNNTEDVREQTVQAWITKTYNYVNDPISIVSVLFFMILLYLIIYLFRIPSGTDKPITISLIETITWILFVIIVFINFFKYVLRINFLDLVSDVTNLSSLPSTYDYNLSGNVIVDGNVKIGNIDLDLNLKQPTQKNEVFSVGKYNLNYYDAQAVCKSFDGDLATFDQIEDYYKNGGENIDGYSWSADQYAYFVVQKDTWNKMKQDPNNKNHVRPSINGGYFSNPYVKMNAFCYAIKPNPSDFELALMDANKDVTVPKTSQDAVVDKKVNFWKQNRDNLLTVYSFNRKDWSEW